VYGRSLGGMVMMKKMTTPILHIVKKMYRYIDTTADLIALERTLNWLKLIVMSMVKIFG